MSTTKLAGRVTAFVFFLFGFTTLYDYFSHSQEQVVSPYIGLLMLVVALLAYLTTRHR